MYDFRGLGWLAPVVFFGVMILCFSLAGFIMGGNFINKNFWLWIVSSAVSSIVVTLFGIYIDRHMRPIIHHEKTGVPMKTLPHTFLSIPVQYWGIIGFITTSLLMANAEYGILAPILV